MYSSLLAVHSLVRWFVLASLLFAIYRAYFGWLGRKPFSKFDNTVRHLTATIAHIQFIFGLWLYFVSPIINYFLNNFKDAVHNREVRFFGMEHSLMMLTAIVVITIGSARAKRKATDLEKFRTMAVWYTVAFIVIAVSVPWAFSSMASRPYFRAF